MAYLGNDLQVAFPVYRNIDDISGSFNSVLTTFALTVSGVAPVPAPLYSQQCLISVGGVVQRPDDSGSEGFRLSGGNIIFASAPATGADFFGVILAGADYVNAGGNFPSGTAAVPSITFNDDLDTGIYNSGVNQLSITTSGTERLRIDSAGQIESVSLGTAAAPAFSFTTDPNTGLYSPGADQVAISTNSSQRLLIDASGNVSLSGPNLSVGGTAPSNAGYSNLYLNNTSGAQLFLSVNSANSRVIYSTATDLNYYTSDASPHVWLTNAAERMRLDSSGRLGLGTSSPSEKLHITTGNIQLTDGYTLQWGGSSTFINGYNAGILQLCTGSTPRVYIDSSGRVGIGTTSPGGTLDIKAAASTAPLIVQGPSSEFARIDSSGRLLVGTSSVRAAGEGFQSSIGTQLFIEQPSSGLTPATFLLNRDDTNGPRIVLGKSRGTAIGSNTIVQAQDALGIINFAGADGTDLDTIAAQIAALVDGTPGTDDMPGRLVFSTTADGASSPTERMRIAQNGVITIQNGAVAVIGTLTDAATITPDFAADCNFTVTLGGNRTIANPSNLTAGQSGSIFLVQDATGSRTVSWGSYWDFPGGTAPTLSTAANAVDRVDYVVRTSTSIHTVFTANYS